MAGNNGVGNRPTNHLISIAEHIPHINSPSAPHEVIVTGIMGQRPGADLPPSQLVCALEERV